jgi:hypothetical protein
MITVHVFGNAPLPVRHVTRDLRALWALEESGLPYRLHPPDFASGELKRPEYKPSGRARFIERVRAAEMAALVPAARQRPSGSDRVNRIPDSAWPLDVGPGWAACGHAVCSKRALRWTPEPGSPP